MASRAPASSAGGVQSVGQIGAEFPEIIIDLLRPLGQLGQILRKSRRPLQGVGGLPGQIGGAGLVLAALQGAVGFGQAIGDVLGVGRQVPPAHQVFFLPRLQLGVLDLLQLVAQQFRPALPVLPGLAQFVGLPLHLHQLPVDGIIGRVLGLGMGVEVQQTQMPGRVGEALAVVLAVDVDEVPADSPHHLGRRLQAVDPEAALALGGDLPVQKQLVPGVHAGLYGYSMAIGVVIFLFSFALSAVVNKVTDREPLEF